MIWFIKNLILSILGARWVQDDEGDFGISFWNILVLVKYKDGVIVRFFKQYKSAPKWLMSAQE